MFENLASYFDIPLLTSDPNPAIIVTYIIVAVMHTVSGLSIRDCSQLLTSLRLLISIMAEDFCGTKGQAKYLAKSVPLDARTVISKLALKPSYKTFVCCPKCSTCYSDNGQDSYPELCSSIYPPSQEICGRRLRKARTVRNHQYDIPTRRFLYHNFNEWLGKMLCRPGMEDMMDRSLSPSSGGIMDDIWDAPGLYDILDPNGSPFINQRTDNEGRYLFSFNMDGFNPFQLKQGGRSASVMAMYMVCLNLPPKERFKLENMFLAGIIPGPNEPSMEEINHFFAPLVDDLLDSYNNGVYYTRTWKYPHGRMTKSALALLICDLPAARQALGFTGPQSANFCSYCKVQLKNINDLNVGGWESRSCEEHRKLAFEWQGASVARRAKITSEHGLRYSEFLRLPYFDPIRHLCVDPMHAFFLRILSRHCQDIWGMDVKIEDGDGLSSDPISSEIRSSANFQHAFRMLRTGSLESLRKIKAGVLRNLAVDQGIPVKGRKHDQLMAMLTKYVTVLIPALHRTVN
jgi:hypothetical protein